jgi:Anti-sigma-K factor rskA
VSGPDNWDHDHVDLLGLITGELGRDDTISAARHLGSCSRCAEEMVDLAIAHGALTAASAAVSRLDEAPTGRPDSDAVLADMVGHDVSRPALPPLEVDTTRTTEHAGRPKRLAVVVAGVAAMVIALVGAGVGVGTVIARPGKLTSGPLVASAALKPIDAPTSASGSIKAVAVGDTRNLTVETKNLKAPSSAHFYEVWMLNTSTQKMLPVGVLPPSGTGTYSMGASIMAGYSAVDISLQTNNGNPAHSSTSVLRATF